MEPDINDIEKKPDATPPIEYKRLPEDQFFESYANHVLFEPTAWDIKLTFGKIEGVNTVVQDVSVRLPWSQIKVGIYFLQVQLAFHEIANGKVHVPKGVINPPLPPTEDQEKDAPLTRKIYDHVQEIFRQFREANPEAF